MTGALVPTRRRSRKPPEQVGKVVPLHPARQTTDEIVRDVRSRSRQVEQAISARLRSLLVEMERVHRSRAEECVPIGVAMDRRTLDDWIAIGQRLLEQGGRA